MKIESIPILDAGGIPTVTAPAESFTGAHFARITSPLPNGPNNKAAPYN
jgi:hypothetical protein